MSRRFANTATQVLGLLPFAQTLTGRMPSPKVMAAAGLVNAPFIRRLAPGLSAALSVGLAVVAIASFVKDMKRGDPKRRHGKVLGGRRL
ncbi:hypothetical protein [Asticcacaulis sp. AND118]|uniref:hypothetical protein n=1 Tax=Asticcacaulis sp. AND118 TaxID=2840468 RepID=UPI001CFFEF09|nr:hypothetical protein [Asticcacaulis sp. AND118]UDF04957.1 hypothetical protein LH365_16300 [Asticcacaulis sp. AND118]